MERWLVLETPDGQSAELAVELDAEAPAALLLDGLAEHFGLRALGSPRASVARTGRQVDPDLPIAAAGLIDGDRLRLRLDGDRSRETPVDDAVVDLVVAGGPASGQRVGLAPGRHVIGRGPGADVTIADPSLSRRHLQLAVDEEGVSVSDVGSSNGTFVEGEPLEGALYLEEGDVVEAGRSLLRVEPRAGRAEALREGRDGLIAFNRPPRVARPAPGREVRLSAAPRPAEPVRLPLGAAAIPLAIGGALFAITGAPTTLMIAAMAPAMTLYSVLERRRSSGSRHKQDLAAFTARVDELEAELDRDRREEIEHRRAAAPDAAELLARAAGLDEALWERRPGDDDFLRLRLGMADLPSNLRAVVGEGGDADLTAKAAARLQAGATLPSVPVAADCVSGHVGIAGRRRDVDALGRWLLAQAAVLHSPAEVVLAAAVPAGAEEQWRWLAWLPHVRHAEGPEPRLAAGPAEAASLIEALTRLVRGRLEVRGGARRPHVLAFIDGAGIEIDRASVAELMANGPTAGITVLWSGRAVGELPGECHGVIELDPDVAGLTVTDVRTGARVENVAADGVDAPYAIEIAHALAPVRDAGAPKVAAAIPDRVSLLDLLELPQPTGDAIAARWQARRDDLAAPIGVSSEGPFAIDFAQTEGVRALIGGMPGAGKSELLQTLVASLAATHPPERLSFLFVDYKGGAAFKDCVNLPHVAGVVTDLDEHLADRARVSLLAELRRREALLAEHGARSLRELERRDPDAAPPSLLVVVDEFATLVKEVPGFVDTMVDVVQRGRSLGLHLVLATQRPRGSVSDAIRANTNVRIAMRMGDAGDSQDIIEAPAAASIPAAIPGRAIAMTGRAAGGAPQLLTFQTAYAGGLSASLPGADGVMIREIRFGGATGAPPHRVLSLSGAEAETDLHLLVGAVASAAERIGARRPRSPWLPPLPAVLPGDALERPDGQSADPASSLVIGLVDDPSRQRRLPLIIDFERDGSLLVYGASGSGKTTVLRGLAAAACRAASPAELHVYGLDFASAGLAPLQALPHCGAIINAGDEERVARLFARLTRLAAERRALFARHGVGSLADYRRQVGSDGAPPRVLVLLDGYAAFAAAYERVNYGDLLQTLNRIVADGRPLGLHLAIAADRRAAVPGALAGVMPGRIVLRLADGDDYATLGVPAAAAALRGSPAGRGVTREGLDLQVALVGADPGAERQAIEVLAKDLVERHPRMRAPRVGSLPDSVTSSSLPAPPSRLRAIVGIGGEELHPLSLDLSEGHALVLGPRRSGRSTAIATIAASLGRSETPARLHVLAARGAGRLECEQTIARVAAAVEQAPAPADPPVVLIIDDADELADGPAAAALEQLVRRGADAGVRLVIGAETQAMQRAYGGFLRELRGTDHALLLQPDPESDGELVGVRLPRQALVALRPGRGYLVERGQAALVQVGSS